MNQQAFDKICETFKQANIEYNLIDHPPCRTSTESAETRAKAGFPNAVGAKALLLKWTLSGGRDEYNVLVLPGFAKLSSKKLKQLFPELKKFRFATSEELIKLCGVPSGAMPPFGNKIFPAVEKLFIDNSITQSETVGFNIANLEKSIIVQSSDYLKVADYNAILDFVEADN